jgi:hypothetical protein
MPSDAFLVPALVVLFAVCVALAAGLVACHRRQVATADQVRELTATERSAVRQLRLASHNLRAIGMTLQGQVEYLDAGGELDIAGIANSATGVFDIADYMHEWAQDAQTPRQLDDATLKVGSALDQAISTVTRSIRPGRRTWHVAPDVLAVRLRVDERALHHVLTRALGVLVRGSRHDDSIDIRLEQAELDGGRKALSVVLEHRTDPSRCGSPILNGGGPDLRLTLARALMEAHGGRLDIEQEDGLGVHLSFPAERIVSGSDDVRDGPKACAGDADSDCRLQGAFVT